MTEEEARGMLAGLKESLLASGLVVEVPERPAIEKVTPSTARDVLDDAELWQFIADQVHSSLRESLSAAFDIQQVDWETLATDLAEYTMGALVDSDLTQYPSPYSDVTGE